MSKTDLLLRHFTSFDNSVRALKVKEKVNLATYLLIAVNLNLLALISFIRFV